MAKLFIVGLLNEDPTPFDNQWVVEYDPTRRGVDPEGRPMIAHLVTTRDAREARDFITSGEAEAYWKQTFGARKDGRPNRPLTAFIVEIQGSRGAVEVQRGAHYHSERPLLAFIAEFFFSS